MHLDDKYVQIREKVDPNLEFLPHWRKARRVSEYDLVIFAMRLYGDIWSGGFLSMNKVRCKCLSITEPVVSTIFTMT